MQVKARVAGEGQTHLCLPCFLTKVYTELGGHGLPCGVRGPPEQGTSELWSHYHPTTSEPRNNPGHYKKQFLGYSASPMALAKLQVPCSESLLYQE